MTFLKTKHEWFCARVHLIDLLVHIVVQFVNNSNLEISQKDLIDILKRFDIDELIHRVNFIFFVHLKVDDDKVKFVFVILLMSDSLLLNLVFKYFLLQLIEKLVDLIGINEERRIL
ncbi:hypothetical protein DMUE_6390, partial [Dictyocoela muelleri]